MYVRHDSDEPGSSLEPGTPAGEIVAAELIARVTATNLHDEFATVVDTASVLADR